ncbi:MAG: hypothetical protein ACE5GW_12165 [Planctomycetota bacterium]
MREPWVFEASSAEELPSMIILERGARGEVKVRLLAGEGDGRPPLWSASLSLRTRFEGDAGKSCSL